jgi:hypothetical protein
MARDLLLHWSWTEKYVMDWPELLLILLGLITAMATLGCEFVEWLAKN